MSKKAELKVCSSPDNTLALTNQVFLSPADAETLTSSGSDVREKCYITFKDHVFTFRPHEKIAAGFVGLSSIQRQSVNVSLNEAVPVTSHTPSGDDIYLSTLKLDVDFLSKNKKVSDKHEAKDLKEAVMRVLEQQILCVGQRVVLDFRGNNLLFRVIGTEVLNLSEIANKSDAKRAPVDGSRGILIPETEVIFEKAAGSAIILSGSTASGGNKIFRSDWNFESMGIGGLNKEFGDIFRRAFASRIFPPALVQKLGISHVKGILLYGPPGTGKTLMARQIGKMLNGKEPKVVNGPEILNKYVGQSEENIRNLFKDAETEYRSKGDESDLHIIIFDELDAICRARGTRNDSTGVGDTVVNQLLAKIDGVEALNNILLIGMTNRKELIDEALLRPGRLEVHMEISLPDEAGRLQILRIHTTNMRNNKFMDEDVDLGELAGETKNYSGAEIEGLVKAATSFAFSRQIDPKNPAKPIDPDQLRITKADFTKALTEVRPAFGVESDEFENCMRNGIINYGDSVASLLEHGKLFTSQVKNSNRTPLVSILLEGPAGSGKTALAAKMAKESDFPYMRLLSPETLVGYSEAAKCQRITKVFEDSYKSPLSVIVVDDIERILEYVPIGPRFSNAILQTLLVLFKKVPPKGRKLFVIATATKRDVLQEMDFMDCFSTTISTPVIKNYTEFKAALADLQLVEQTDLHAAAQSFTSESITIKKLIMIAELARQGTKAGTLERFVTLMTEYQSPH